MGVMWGERVDGGYKPSLVYRLFKPRDITGNEINGVGEPEKRRPTPIYHWFGVLKVPFNRVWWSHGQCREFNTCCTRRGFW